MSQKIQKIIVKIYELIKQPKLEKWKKLIFPKKKIGLQMLVMKKSPDPLEHYVDIFHQDDNFFHIKF